MHVESGMAEVAGGRLYYEVAGAGHPLVLIHGWGLDRRMWDDQFTELAKRFQVVRYDLRGFGKSSVPGSDSYAHADDLSDLLTTLGISQAHIVGLSMGGWVATNFVLTHPAMARTLILVDAALIGYEWSAEWKAWWRPIENAGANAGAKAANELWLQHPIFAPAREKPQVAARLEQMIHEYSGWHWVNSDMHRKIKPPDSERLHQIKIPALIVVGERDVRDFQTIASILEKGIAGAKKVTLPGVGHMANIEGPAQFNETVLKFLDSAEITTA